MAVLHILCLSSSGPHKCSACIKEDLFEDPTSILKEGGVSTCVVDSDICTDLLYIANGS